MVSSYDVSMAETSFIAGAFSPHKSKDHALSLSIDDATITQHGKKTAFSHASYDFTASADEGQQTEVSVEALTSDLIPATLTPIALDASEKRAQDPVTHDVTFNVEKFMVTGNGFDLDVNGNVSLKTSELLPLVDIRVTTNGTVTVLKALQDNGYISPEIGQIIIASLKRIAPEWNEQSTAPLQFGVHRTATEPFMIGKMKADELLAIALKEWYVRSGGTEVPAKVEQPAEPGLSGITPPEGTTPNAAATGDATSANQIPSDTKAPAAIPAKNSPQMETKTLPAMEPARVLPGDKIPADKGEPSSAAPAAPAPKTDDSEDAD